MITFAESMMLIKEQLLDANLSINIPPEQMVTLKLAVDSITLNNLCEKMQQSTADNIAIIVGSYGSIDQQCPHMFKSSAPGETTDIFNIDAHFDQPFAKEMNCSTQNMNVFTTRAVFPVCPDLRILKKRFPILKSDRYQSLTEKTEQLVKSVWSGFMNMCNDMIKSGKKLMIFQFTSPFPLPLLVSATKPLADSLNSKLAYVMGYGSFMPVISCNKYGLSVLDAKKPFEKSVWDSYCRGTHDLPVIKSGTIAQRIGLLQFSDCFDSKPVIERRAVPVCHLLSGTEAEDHDIKERAADNRTTLLVATADIVPTDEVEKPRVPALT